jgi:hypothetical protein
VILAASIETALAPLIGLPLWAAGQAADMLWLQFGAKVRAPSRRDPNRETGEYALHVQCPWRISGAAGVVAGSSDELVVDRRLATWLDAHRTDPLRVTSLQADRCGGFIAALTHEFALEVFPEDSSGEEQWRLLQPGSEAPHFVVLGAGVESLERSALFR